MYLSILSVDVLNGSNTMHRVLTSTEYSACAYALDGAEFPNIFKAHLVEFKFFWVSWHGLIEGGLAGNVPNFN